VEDCIIFDDVDIGRDCKIRRAIIEKHVRLPAGTVIGYDPAEDARRYHLTDSGIVVIGGPRSPVSLTVMTV